MRILVICPHYAPDVAPTGEVMGSIVEGLVARGHEVDIVTALPWYLHHRIEQGWEHKLSQTEQTPWGSITRLHPFPTNKTNLWARLLGFGGFTALATNAGMRAHKPDVVLTMSPPLVIGFAGWIAAKRHRVPYVFNIQDIFPDVAIDVGAITNNVVIKVAYAVERFLYRRANAVTVLSKELSLNVTNKIGASRGNHVVTIPNFVDLERISPGERTNSYRDEFGLGDKIVVMYAGNLGYSQSVEMLIEAARSMGDRDDVVFVINGSGSRRAELEQLASGLANVVMVGLQPRERVPEVLAAADIHTVLLGEGLAKSSVPSKLYSILAAERPVVASVDSQTEVERAIVEAEAGAAVAPNDMDAFVSELTKLVDDPDLRQRCGRNARQWVEQWVSPTAVARKYEELFASLIDS